VRDFNDSSPAYHKIKEYPKSFKGKSITSGHMKKYPKVWADGKKYLAWTRNHCFAIKNGTKYDWSDNRSLRVEGIIEVYNKVGNTNQKPLDITP